MASATKFELPLQISDLARLADDVMPAAGIGAGWNERHDCCASPRRVGRLAKPKAITGRPSGRPSLFAIRPSWVIVFARQQHIRVEQRQQKPLIPDDPLALDGENKVADESLRATRVQFDIGGRCRASPTRSAVALRSPRFLTLPGSISRRITR
jgi:hypothetical protein